MVFLKKLLLLLVATAVVYFGGFFLGVLVTGDDTVPRTYAYMVFGATALTLLGGIIYLAVDAAQRHNR